MTSEGKVFPMRDSNYPYEEAKDMDGEKRVWVVRHKETKVYRVARYRRKTTLNFLTTYGWWKMRQFNHHNKLNGIEAFYDPKEKILILITEFCYY
jgi:hypothetical protein